MSDYKNLVKSEAKKFCSEQAAIFAEDGDEFGGKSDGPNFARWLDRTKKLNDVVETQVKSWGLKEFQWVQSNTRNKAPQGGDPRSNAFGSFYSDLLHEVKKVQKQKA